VNPYETLGVTPQADQATIRRAYRKRAARAHPDRAGGNAEEMSALNCAYRLIGDEKSRARFDAGGGPEVERTQDERATMFLCQAFAQALDHLDVGTDLIAHIRAAITAQRADLESKKRDAAKHIARAEKRLKRLKYSGRLTTHNFFEAILREQISGANRAAAQLTENVALIGRALELLEDFSYEADKRSPHPAGVFMFSQAANPTWGR
jgi:curved DNA-binding protein CbpA